MMTANKPGVDECGDDGIDDALLREFVLLGATRSR